MKSSLAIAVLVFALSLCNLTDRLANINRNQNDESSSSQNANESNTNSSPSQESSPPNLTDTGDQNRTANSSSSSTSDNILNGKAISKPDPVYPPLAKTVRASGTVIVQVTVDETGKVISAQATSGHPLLRAAATQAAYQARFEPTLLSGKPVKVKGVLTYEFKPE